MLLGNIMGKNNLIVQQIAKIFGHSEFYTPQINLAVKFAIKTEWILQNIILSSPANEFGRRMSKDWQLSQKIKEFDTKEFNFLLHVDCKSILPPDVMSWRIGPKNEKTLAQYNSILLTAKNFGWIIWPKTKRILHNRILLIANKFGRRMLWARGRAGGATPKQWAERSKQ